MTADAPRNADDFCYRHPDRRSFVLCQRCLRTICPECQTQSAVGVICPECMTAQKQQTPKRVRRAVRRVDSRPLVTYWIVGVTVGFFILGFAFPVVQSLLAFNSAFIDPTTGVPFQPWRIFTVALVHSGFWHVGLNMLAVWLIGRSLEPLLGHGRFLALYVISALGGSTAVALWSTTPFVIGFDNSVVGASGAVFGLLGALLVIGRHIGANITGILIILGINLVIGFIPGFGISWQSHLGGLAVGALLGLIYARTRRADQSVAQNLLVGAVVVALVAACAVPALV
ncbi:rhomboid family intramembrane serine protease [Microbacterium sp. LRZ72]|uniref:rhomboid family intramembrane serine protease n=1 Tax=Microbacterium sp. LRZ72 TaxID=2942481 RepID=UPI0029A3B527|nr:rhomboid family intramembrane serine protease [Microbacterium sp. LRZ72]MDX2376249.1 rhomboid family intramembrane serine protease [Microbacterium sp. LRZ72]